MLQHNTKIVATLGPASSSLEALEALIKEGVAIFRLNFSHGTHADHKTSIDRILSLNEKLGTHVGILADLQGPKLRIGQIENNALVLKEGDIITITNEECIGTMEKIYMSYDSFADDLKVGEMVLVDDGKLQFEVVEVHPDKDIVKLKCLFGGILSSNKGVNLPDTEVKLPSLTEKDLEDLDFIVTQPVNWIALSFVRKAKDVEDLISKVEAAGHYAKVISKIEKPEAIKNIKCNHDYLIIKFLLFTCTTKSTSSTFSFTKFFNSFYFVPNNLFTMTNKNLSNSISNVIFNNRNKWSVNSSMNYHEFACITHFVIYKALYPYNLHFYYYCDIFV